MDNAPAGRVVFSQLFNESETFLQPCIETFLAYTGPESVLVLNLPQGRAIDPALHALSDRVFLINGGFQRRLWDHTILAGHLESFGFALEHVPDFSHFSALASNSLMVRRFDLPAALSALAASHNETRLDLEDLPKEWHWRFVRQMPEYIGLLKREWGITHATSNQIEGLFAARSDWALLHDRLDALARLGATMRPDLPVPIEEVLPGTCFASLGSGRYTYVCHVFWDRQVPSQSRSSNVDFADILTMAQHFPPHICAFKWFERSPQAIETAAVVQPWSRALLAELADAVAAGDQDRMLVQRGLLERLAATLRAREAWRPFTARWWGQGASRSGSLPDQVIEATGQKLPLEDIGAPAGAAFLMMEKTGAKLRLGFDITEDGGATRLRLRCAGPAGDGALQGFLYLDPQVPGRLRTLRVRLAQARVAAEEEAVRAFRFTADTGYCPPARLRFTFDTATHRAYHFREEGWHPTEIGWYGIPILPGMELDLLLEMPADGEAAAS
ncbi:hypothetical protein JMJ55_03320 [Belnapia sp. T6]|uniref:Uncharacterized protein n=1 Tax=Belnapia mucosa TaxID=2804532 RepID=A0ABS1V0Y6_9PROT|nr:hypothetical protein [Belnapia mucosa]MBL6454339.1 hypothetical protein [Belnapia mucosa]